MWCLRVLTRTVSSVHRRQAFRPPCSTAMSTQTARRRIGVLWTPRVRQVRNIWSWQGICAWSPRSSFPDRVLNLHPALLPSFKGAHAIQDAFEAGVKVTGVTVHFANEEYDKGPIVAQRAVPVLEDDTQDDLEARIHEVEHELYPEVLRWIAAGRVSVGEDRKVHVAPEA